MIVESGSHTDLMARAGRYAQFYAMRFSREPSGSAGAKAEMASISG
jgi:hypothetical protein